MTNLKDKTVMTSKELCEFLKITKQSLTTYNAQGIPMLISSGKINRYVLEDVIQWLNERKF